MRSIVLFAALISALAACSEAQQRAQTGPVVNSGGPVWDVDDVDFATPMDMDLKAVFEWVTASQNPAQPNRQIGTTARYLNMHARAGVPSEQVSVAAVVHGGASHALLKDEFFQERHGVDNPNKDVIREILATGGQIVLCGQTAGSRGITKDQLLPGVQLALSAMTAMTVFQSEGYQVILW